VSVYHFGEMEWHVPVAEGTDVAQAAEAGRQGVRRRLLAQGEGGFYTQIVEMPPKFEAPAHSHSHAEVFMVLEGSCSVNGEELGPYDTMVIPKDGVYGFTSGPDGLRFLVVRTGEASFTTAES
jgi:quercetin dioxygenase-like cupin family protein